MIGYQVVLRAVDDRVLAPDAARRRAFASTVARVGRPHGLYCFGLADTHGHAGLICDNIGRFIHDVRLALSPALGLVLEPATTRPIRDSWHAESLLAYVHQQDQHHGSNLDPLREATSLPDLCGLRPGGLWLAERVRTVAPRVSRAALLEQWGIPKLEEDFGLERLAECAAAAVGVAQLTGRERDVVAARLACVHAGDATVEAFATALGISQRRTSSAKAAAFTEAFARARRRRRKARLRRGLYSRPLVRSVRRFRADTPDLRLVRAIRLQVGLRGEAPAETAFVRAPPPSKYRISTYIFT